MGLVLLVFGLIICQPGNSDPMFCLNAAPCVRPCPECPPLSEACERAADSCHWFYNSVTIGMDVLDLMVPGCNNWEKIAIGLSSLFNAANALGWKTYLERNVQVANDLLCAAVGCLGGPAVTAAFTAVGGPWGAAIGLYALETCLSTKCAYVFKNCAKASLDCASDPLPACRVAGDPLKPEYQCPATVTHRVLACENGRAKSLDDLSKACSNEVNKNLVGIAEGQRGSCVANCVNRSKSTDAICQRFCSNCGDGFSSDTCKGKSCTQQPGKNCWRCST